jgi:hypothetical protein
MRWILAVGCLLFGLGYVLLTDWYPDVEWLQGVFMHLLWPVLVALMALAAILCPRRFLARDPVLSSWAVLGLAGCLLILPLIIAREGQAGIDAEREAALRETREALRLERLRQAQALKEAQADRAERAKTDRFVQYEGRVPPATLQQLRDLDARMQAEVDRFAEAYRSALDSNPTKGPESWIRFRTLDQLEVELAAHKALYEQTRAFAQFIESFEDTYTSEIEAMGLQPPADRIAIAEMERILQFWEQSRLYDLRQLDVRLLGAAIAALNGLRDAWGDWSYDPRDKRVRFTDPAREAAFLEDMRLFQAIALEVQAIREALDPAERPDS